MRCSPSCRVLISTRNSSLSGAGHTILYGRLFIAVKPARYIYSIYLPVVTIDDGAPALFKLLLVYAIGGPFFCNDVSLGSLAQVEHATRSHRDFKNGRALRFTPGSSLKPANYNACQALCILQENALPMPWPCGFRDTHRGQLATSDMV